MAMMVKLMNFMVRSDTMLNFTLNIDKLPNVGKFPILPAITKCPTDSELGLSTSTNDLSSF